MTRQQDDDRDGGTESNTQVSEPDIAIRSWSDAWRLAVFIPDQQLTLFVVIRLLPNLSLTSLGVWLWDDTASTARGFPYAYRDAHLPAFEGDFNNGTITERLELASDRPSEGFRLHYHDRDQLHFDLDVQFVGHRLANSGGGTRFHQTLWASGNLTLPDRTVVVDSPGALHRRWGPPLAFRALNQCYGGNRESSFHAVWVQEADGMWRFRDGAITQDGETTRIKDASRSVIETLGDYPLDIRLEVVDEDDRAVTITGMTINAGEIEPWTGHHSVMSQTHWLLDGHHLCGNDTELGPRPDSDGPRRVAGVRTSHRDHRLAAGAQTGLRLVPPTAEQSAD